MNYKLLLLSLILLLSGNALMAQGDLKMPGLDASPADIAYFRTDDGPKVKVVYSRPQKNDRVIFGDLVPYGKVWRTGANEATEITFMEDVTFGGEEVEAGTYTLFTIPSEDEWEVMLNSQLNQWGAYRMQEDRNVATTAVKPANLDEPVEAFTIAFREVDGGAHLVMAWDQTMVEVPVMMK